MQSESFELAFASLPRKVGWREARFLVSIEKMEREMEFEPKASSLVGWQSIIQVITNKRVNLVFGTSLPRNVSQQIVSGSVQRNPRHRQSSESGLAKRFKSFIFYDLRLNEVIEVRLPDAQTIENMERETGLEPATSSLRI